MLEVEIDDLYFGHSQLVLQDVMHLHVRYVSSSILIFCNLVNAFLIVIPDATCFAYGFV